MVGDVEVLNHVSVEGESLQLILLMLSDAALQCLVPEYQVRSDRRTSATECPVVVQCLVNKIKPSSR